MSRALSIRLVVLLSGEARDAGSHMRCVCRIWSISLEDIQHLNVIMPHLKTGLSRGLKQGVRSAAPSLAASPNTTLSSATISEHRI